MKLIFENWRKHLNEEDHGIDAQPAPFGPEEDLLITMVEAFKESHPELNIGEIGYTDAGQFYVEFDGEKVDMPGSEEYLYRDLVKRTGEGTRNTPRRYGGSMDEKTEVIKEATISPAGALKAIDAWLIRIVAGLGSFKFDPGTPPLPIDGRGAAETWQEQQEKVAAAIDAINSGKYTAQQLQRATEMAHLSPPVPWKTLAAKIAQRPKPRTAMGKIKGMFGLEESEL